MLKWKPDNNNKLHENSLFSMLYNITMWRENAKPYSRDLKYSTMKWNKMNPSNKERKITPKHKPWDASEKRGAQTKEKQWNISSRSFDHGHVIGISFRTEDRKRTVSQFLQTHYISLISWCLLLWFELRWSERTIIRLHPAFTREKKATTVELPKSYLKWCLKQFIIHLSDLQQTCMHFRAPSANCMNPFLSYNCIGHCELRSFMLIWNELFFKNV